MLILPSTVVARASCHRPRHPTACPGTLPARSVAPVPREQPASDPGERHSSCGFFTPKKKKLCFQVTWNQPGCCVPPHWDGTIATLVLHRANCPSRASGHHEAPRGICHATRGLWGDAGSQARSWAWGMSPPSSNLPQAPAREGFGFAVAPGSGTLHPRPPPAFYSLTPSSFSPAPCWGS